MPPREDGSLGDGDAPRGARPGLPGGIPISTRNGQAEHVSPNVRGAASISVFHTAGKARIAYFDDNGDLLGHQDVTGLQKVDLPVDL